MDEVPEDPIREHRITYEAVVDAYGPEEQAMGWYYYLDMHITFPFKARCNATRKTSPLKVGELVKVIEMADEEDCMNTMIVIVERKGDTFGVPLSTLDPVEGDEEMIEAIKDWHYWVARGHSFG
jgi:hypothetical protein